MKSVLHITCDECRLHVVSFLLGDVSPLLRRRVARHIDFCSSCYQVYRQDLDLMRDLKREVPRLGQGHHPQFDRVWLAIQNDIMKPKSDMPRFQMRYGLAVLALLLGFLLPLTMDNQNVMLASPPTQPAPLAELATPNGTEPGVLETAVAISYLTVHGQVTPEAPHQTSGPSLDVIRTP